MAGPEESTVFPRQPYYIPGYTGFIPQYKYQIGKSFGKITREWLTDPTAQKISRSLLAPPSKQKIDGESSEMKNLVHGYIPVDPGHSPYEKDVAATNFPDPRPPAPVPGLAKENLKSIDTNPMPFHHPGEYVPRISSHPAFEEREQQLPEPVRSEGVTMPRVGEITDVKHKRFPNLDIPNAIQQKVIPGYTGCIPCLSSTYGINYTQSVKAAMKEFEKYQRN